MPLLCSIAVAAAIGAPAPALPAQVHPPAPVACVAMPPAGQDGAHVATVDEPGRAGKPGFGQAAGPAQLDSARGGSDTQTNNNMQVNGTVAGNSATNVVSGTNTISAGAFSDASGIPMVIQNTGSNVLIQNATIINLRMQ